jgi:LruC domain-containing protein
LSGNSVTFESTANLTIGTNGSVITSGTFAPCGVTKNFGTITANQISCNQGTPSIFNAGTITTAGEFFINRTNFINHGTATAGTWLRMNSTNQVLNKGTISATNINNTSSTIANYGDFLFNETNGQLTFNNSSSSAIIINHDGATIKGYNWSGGLSFYNDGFIEVYNCENTSTDLLYNSCTLIIKNKFVFAKVTLDKGSITGGKPDDINATNDASLWKPVPLLETSNPVTFILKNGSMIKATKLFIKNSPNLFDGQSGDISGMQVDNITLDGAAGGNTTFNGNLVFSNPTITNNAHGNIITQNGVSMVGSFDESKYTIATCGGYYAPGNPGNPTPSNPTFPITVGDATNYTYAFEDRWPSYGDFDLNDIVLSVKNKSAETYGNGSLKSVQFQISLDAVGASKMLGVGIRFLNLPANTNLKTFTVNGNNASFESGQTMPTLILFTDAHKEFGFTDSRPFINTYQNSSTNKASKAYNVVLTFNSGSTVSSSVFNVANLDMFIITEAATTSTKRMEVHMAGYAPTDLANTSMFKSGNDDSSAGHYYLSNENLAWGVIIPGDFAWPLETKKVTDVYSLFKSWVSSGGAENREWYTTHNNEVYTNQ